VVKDRSSHATKANARETIDMLIVSAITSCKYFHELV